jgi:curved DNA-binding protein CbpA
MLFIKKKNQFKFFQFNQKRFQTGDLYKILDVDSKVSEGDLKKKYFELAKKYHPDVNPSKDAKSKFIEINNAYETLSNKQKRAQYDEQRQYGGFSQGFQSPPNYQSYQPPRSAQGKAGFRKDYQQRNDFDDIMRFWNEMVQEETRKSQFKNQQSSGYSSNYQNTTIKRDAYGNIRVETKSRGGQDNDFNWKYDANGGENLRRARGGKFENIFDNVFKDPWKIFTNASTSTERPTILDFPSKFSIIQTAQHQNNILAQFQVGDVKNRQIGEIVETSTDRFSFIRNGVTLSTSRFWTSSSGQESGTIEDKNQKKVATVTQNNQPPMPSLVAAFLPFMVTHYVIKNNQEKIIGYISSFNFIFSSTVFYNKNLSAVVRIRGAMNVFGFNLIEYSDVSIGIGSTFDPSVIIMFSIWNTLKKQRSQNSTVVKSVINSVLEFGKNLLSGGKK